MNASKNKMWSKGKIERIELNNKLDKAYDKASSNSDEISPNQPEASPGLEINLGLDKASPSSKEVTPDPDMEMDLVPEWAEYKEEYSSDQVDMSEEINHLEKF